MSYIHKNILILIFSYSPRSYFWGFTKTTLLKVFHYLKINQHKKCRGFTLNSASFSRFGIAKATVLNEQRLSHIPY
jgi:hypothetical protein